MAKKMRASTKKAIKIALEHLATPDSSIRKACKAAGITPATLYNNTKPAQLAEARKQAESAPKPRRQRVARNPSAPAPVVAPIANTGIDFEYVAKLQKKLLDRYESEE